jgi:hypothetical protein
MGRPSGLGPFCHPYARYGVARKMLVTVDSICSFFVQSLNFLFKLYNLLGWPNTNMILVLQNFILLNKRITFATIWLTRAPYETTPLWLKPWM